MAEDIRINIKADGVQAEKNIKGVSKAVDNLGDKSSKANPKLQNFTNTLLSLEQIGNILNRLKEFGVEVGEVADDFNLMQSKLQLITEGTEEFNKAQEEVINISNEARVPLDATADLYAKIARATKSAGIEGTNLSQVTETVSKALKVSGATTQESTSTILQLGQALASGVLRGEEFNSISENGSRIAQALAESLGVTTGALRKMASDGKLTTDVVLKALADQAKTINEEFEKMPVTIGDSMVLMKNALSEAIGAFDEATGASTSLAESIANFSKLVPVFGDYMVAISSTVRLRTAEIEKYWVDMMGVMNQGDAILSFGETSKKFEENANQYAMRSAKLALEIREHQSKVDEYVNRTKNSWKEASDEINKSKDAQIAKNDDLTKSTSTLAKNVGYFNGKLIDASKYSEGAKDSIAEIESSTKELSVSVKKTGENVGYFNGKLIDVSKYGSKSKKTTQELKKELEDSGKKGKKAGDDVSSGMDKIEKATRKATTEIKKQNEELQRHISLKEKGWGTPTGTTIQTSVGVGAGLLTPEQLAEYEMYINRRQGFSVPSPTGADDAKLKLRSLLEESRATTKDINALNDAIAKLNATIGG